MVKQFASLILISILLTVLGFASSSNLHAQELTEFSDTYWIYYEDERPNSLDAMLWLKNICLEAVIKLNPYLDFGNITYGTQLLLPLSEPCYYSDNSDYWNYPPQSRLKYYENGEWLAEPYYSDDFVYANGSSVQEIAEELNVCVDDLLADNILLQHFEAYKAFSTWTSFDVFIPQDAQPCNPEASIKPVPTTISLSSELVTPLMMTEMFNICPEEFYSQSWMFGEQIRNSPTSNITFPSDAKPCYNESGKRLIYFDGLGRKLDEPYYSSLLVTVAIAGEAAQDIARRLGVCLHDLLKINGFPPLPFALDIELLIPSKRACPQNVNAVLVENNSNQLQHISQIVNVCPDQLIKVNPQLSFVFNRWDSGWYIPNSPYYGLGVGWNLMPLTKWWILVPSNAQPCYWKYHISIGQYMFDMQQWLNICFEEFSTYREYLYQDYLPLYIPNAAQPCYNAQGQRLYYPPNYTTDMRVRLANPILEYSPLKVHLFAANDNVYSISQQYNVCVHDLLNLNPVLKEVMPVNFPTFIPDTRPCYDTATGVPLTYEDSEGNALPTPQVADQLLYYGGQPFGRMSNLYNVCQNRIVDANQDKIDGKVSYLGWIIPTDRPPCYDNDGLMIDYVCYDQPIDFSVDYSKVDEPLRLNNDGTHCYYLADPVTMIWHNNQRYQLVNYNGTLLQSRAFTAWCYGVSLEDINTINDDPQVLAMLPYKTRLIPSPTRDCYLDKRELVGAPHTVHVVQAGDTLHSIARKHDKLAFWIALTNQLDAQNTVWEGQVLVIPYGITNTQLAAVGGSGAVFVSWFLWSKRRGKTKRKRKNGE